VLLMYFKLVIWPWPLFIHYHWPYLNSLATAWPYVVPVLLLIAAMLVLLWRNSPLGFVGTWVFAVLAPTSVVPIIFEMAAERRMYLPLAPILATMVASGYLIIRSAPGASRGWAAGLTAVLVLIYGVVSAVRVASYADERQLWADVVRSQPDNYMAHSVLGCIDLFQRNLPSEAVVEFEEALRLNPDHRNSAVNLAASLSQTGRHQEAIDKLEAVRKSSPDSPSVLDNLGFALIRAGRPAEAATHLEHLVAIYPRRADVHLRLGALYSSAGHKAKAIEHFKQAVQINPDLVEAHASLGLLLESSQADDAVAHLREAIQLAPDQIDYRMSLGNLLRRAGRTPESVVPFQAAIRLQPERWQAHESLIESLVATNRLREAADAAETAGHAAEASGDAAAAEKFRETLRKLRNGEAPTSNGR